MRREAAMPLITPVEPDVAASQARYKAKIDTVSPQRARDSFEQHESCFLGISLENSNFVRPKLIGILEWIARRFPRCTVLVGDSIHRITLETTRGLSPDAALAEALRLGRSFLEEEQPVFDGFAAQTQFAFTTCSELQSWPCFAHHHRSLIELYGRNDRFRSSVESFGRQYHDKHSAALSGAERAWRIQRSSAYFLEEFAMFASLKQRGVPVMVYPGSFSTLAEIASGDHPEAPEELRELVVVSLHLRGR
jgi:tRNA-dependent cyclodipeptide synthase